jgi:hypothetical protein
MSEDFVEVYSYSRKQAIEDGVLIDVTEWAKECGFKIPVAVTAAVWSDLEEIPEKFKGQLDLRGRAHDLLFMAALAGRKQRNTDCILFELILHIKNTKKQQYKMLIGPGDDLKPVITILQPNED